EGPGYRGVGTRRPRRRRRAGRTVDGGATRRGGAHAQADRAILRLIMALKAGHAVLAGALLAAVFWALNRSADHESLGDAAATGNPAALPRATANDAILYK